MLYSVQQTFQHKPGVSLWERSVHTTINKQAWPLPLGTYSPVADVNEVLHSPMRFFFLLKPNVGKSGRVACVYVLEDTKFPIPLNLEYAMAL